MQHPTIDDAQDDLTADGSGEQTSAGNSGTSLLPAGTRARLLTAAEQELYLQALTRGASPAGACTQLGISVLDVQATIEQNSLFQERARQAKVLLSQNVAAALYRAAMEGSVPAQTFFLRNQPPPHWQAGEAGEPTDDPYQKQSYDELIAFARASGIDWPAEDPPGANSPPVAD